MTDSELLSAHLRGDPEAFAGLLRRHLDLVPAKALHDALAPAAPSSTQPTK